MRAERKPLAWPMAAALLAGLIFFQACDSPAPNQGPAETGAAEPIAYEAEVPLVTLTHWKDSTPGERYSFLIGFITMLELEKEWQGRVGGEIMPFEKSLVRSWTTGFANRPLTEIYNGLNRFIADHPGDLDKPVAEAMWFLFVKPRLDEENAADAESTPSF